MLTPNDIIKYILSEKSESKENLDYDNLMYLDELISRGTALTNLKFENQSKVDGLNICRFSAERNFSKFKPGDKAKLISGKSTVKATIIESEMYSLDLAIPSKRKIEDDERWNLILEDYYYNETIIDSLKKLRPGYPGWIHFNSIYNGEVEKFLRRKPRHNLEKADQELLEKYEVDNSQERCIRKSISLPEYFAVQGPPGTGKTQVLALTAEILCRKNERVVILAPTHQAVNNVLNNIKRINRDRQIVKIGDPLKSEGLDNSVLFYQFRQFDELLSNDFFEDNLILGMTYHSAIYNLVNRRNRFLPTVVMIDEAGQLSAAYGSTAGMIGVGSILLYGDDKQMPPIVSSELQGHRLSKSLFALAKERKAENVERLEVTYRLNKEICSVISKSFYNKDGEFLNSAANAENRKLSIDIGKCKNSIVKNIFSDDHSMIWISYNSGYYKQYNPVETKIAADIIDYVLKSGMKKTETAVVTPFRRAAAEIRRLLLLDYEPDELPIIDTVERVQGLTVDLIIYPLTASDPDYIDQVSHFLLNENRLNVSISRARKKVIILASDELMSCKPKLVSAYKTKRKLEEIRRECRELRFIA